jgi:hypothetical protein
MAQANGSLSPNPNLDHAQLQAAIAVVTRQLKEQGVKTSLIARRKIIALAIEHLRASQAQRAKAACVDLTKVTTDAQAEGLDSRAKCNRALREPDLHVFAKLFENCLKRSLEAKAFSGREIGGDDDVLDVLVGHFVDVDLTRQPAS